MKRLLALCLALALCVSVCACTPQQPAPDLPLTPETTPSQSVDEIEKLKGNIEKLPQFKTESELKLAGKIESEYLETNEKVIVVDTAISPNGKASVYAVHYGNKPEAEGAFALDPMPIAEIVVNYGGEKVTLYKEEYIGSLLQPIKCDLFWADDDTLIFGGSSIYYADKGKTVNFNKGIGYEIVSADVKNNMYAQIIGGEMEHSLQIVDVESGEQIANFPLTDLKDDWFNCNNGALKIAFNNEGNEVILAYADNVTKRDQVVIKLASYSIADKALSDWQTVAEPSEKYISADIYAVESENIYFTIYQKGNKLYYKYTKLSDGTWQLA